MFSKTKSFRLSLRVSVARNALSVLCLFLISVGSAFAQSADRDNPTRLTATEISGGAVASNTEYFYSFTAGPGELTITPEVTSNDFSCAFSIDVFDTRNNSVVTSAIIATNRNSEVGATRSVQLGRRQSLTMRLKFDGNAGRYRVRLGGVKDLPSTYAGTDVRYPVGPPAADTPAKRSSGRGTLRVEMDNGSIQEFDLSRVRQVTVQP